MDIVINEVGRRPYLDGLRGVAACVVFFGHLTLALFPAIVSFAPHEMHFSGEIMLGVSPLSWLWKGSFAVCIFFVLSGYVLASFCHTTHLSVMAQVLRRYLRLAVPMLMTSAIAWAVMALGWTRNVEAARAVTHSDWLSLWYNGFEPSLWGTIREALFDAFRYGRSDYNSNLWTMRIELVGSVGIFLAYALVRNVSVRIVVICCVLGLYYDSYYSLFAIGALLYELESPFHRLLAGLVPSTNAREWLLSIVFVLGLYFGAYSHTPDGMVPTWHFFFPKSLPTTAYHMVGAVLVLAALLYCSWIQRALSGVIGRYLGRLSFVLYLVHIPLICTVTAWSVLLMQNLSYGANAFIAAALTTIFVFGISTLLYRYVDLYTTSFSREAGKAFDRAFPEKPKAGQPVSSGRTDEDVPSRSVT